MEAFSRLMTELLSRGDTPALKAWLRSILGSVVVGDKTVRIVGSRDVLADAITGKYSGRQNVGGFVPEWRAPPGEDDNYVYSIAL